MFVLRAIFKDLEPSDLMYPRGEEPESEFKKSVDRFKVISFHLGTFPFLVFSSRFLHLELYST
jgi:hypothetical protein